MADKTLNTQINNTITIFNVKLDAIFDKTDSGYTILVLQEVTEGGSSVTVAELAEKLQEDINDLLNKNENDFQIPKLNFEWPDGVKSIAESLSISVKEVYLYIHIPIEKQADKTIEYAFGIAINNSGGLNFPIKIDSVGVKFWNTTNKNVLNALGIINIDDYKPS